VKEEEGCGARYVFVNGSVGSLPGTVSRRGCLLGLYSHSLLAPIGKKENEMAKWETSIFVQRSVEDVFAFVTDPRQGSKWHRSNEIVPISAGPIRQGSRYRLTGKFLLWKFDSETVVSQYEENRLVAYQATSGPYPYLLRYIFEPVGKGTRLTEVGEADPPPLMRLAIGLFVGNAKRNGERGLRLLKSSLESGAGR
jgi:hypothetical protein